MVTQMQLRHAAADRGDVRYDPGVPCKRGHTAQRYTTNGGCVDCMNVQVRRAEAPLRNQMRLTAMAVLPGNVVPDEGVLGFFNSMLLKSSADWYAEYLRVKDQPGGWKAEMVRAYAREYARQLLTLEQLDPTAAAEVPLDLYIENGWTPAQLVQHGYASVRGVEIAPAFEVPVIPPADPNV